VGNVSLYLDHASGRASKRSIRRDGSASLVESPVYLRSRVTCTVARLAVPDDRAPSVGGGWPDVGGPAVGGGLRQTHGARTLGRCRLPRLNGFDVWFGRGHRATQRRRCPRSTPVIPRSACPELPHGLRLTSSSSAWSGATDRQSVGMADGSPARLGSRHITAPQRPSPPADLIWPSRHP